MLKKEKQKKVKVVKAKEKKIVKSPKKLIVADKKLSRGKIAEKKIIKKSAKKVNKLDLFTRSAENPIISSIPTNNWELWQTFNPAAILLDDKVHFLYRALGGDGISRWGYANSNDGFLINERISYPVYEHQVGQVPVFNIYSYFSGGGWGGAEDPRLVRVDKENKIYRADYILRAVYLNPGRHKVEFIYDPLSFKIGLFITCLTLIILTIIVFNNIIKRNK